MPQIATIALNRVGIGGVWGSAGAVSVAVWFGLLSIGRDVLGLKRE